MRRTLLSALVAGLACALAPFAPARAEQAPAPGAPLRVGASRLPHAALIEAVLPELKAQGIAVEVRIYDDYSLPNIAVANGDLDANFFQTEPYLWRWRAAHGAALVPVGRIHVETMGIYSRKLKDLRAVKDNAMVVVPQDPANQGRALTLLAKAGLLKLDWRRGLDAGIGDIVENPHKLRFRPEQPDKLAGLLGAADLAVINGNYALEGKLPPSSELFRESGDSPFPNVVVTLQESAGDPRIAALVVALRGPVARKAMEKYGGAVVPAE